MKPTTPVLRFVNRIRRAIGDEPLSELPKGARSSAFSCPLAVAIGHQAAVCSDSIIVRYLREEQRDALVKSRWLDSHRIPDSDVHVAINCPPSVHDFVRDFDNQRYPEFEAES